MIRGEPRGGMNPGARLALGIHMIEEKFIARWEPTEGDEPDYPHLEDYLDEEDFEYWDEDEDELIEKALEEIDEE